MKKPVLLLLILLNITLTLGAQASDSHDHDNHPDESHEHHEQGVTKIDSAMATQVGIATALVGPQLLQQSATVFGRLTTAPEHTSHVQARFPGIIRSVVVNIGDQVNTGDLLAVVESNESLKHYDIRAPISGTIVQRHANAGEITQVQLLFSISSFDYLWVELRIFPSQQKSLSIGQPVRISADGLSFNSHISHLLPAEAAAPYLIARAKITGEGWFPGLMVEGTIVVNEFEVPLAVKKSALQSLGNQIGIFVKEADSYHFTPLQLGRSDEEFIEVLAGLEGNIEYVLENSYLLKADIEKSEAEHEH
jgi:cobalt-zinc-cadmium efflux system membrane fusion protein